MKVFLRELEELRTVHLVTVDSANKPHTRTLDIVKVNGEDDLIYLIIDKKDDVYEQIEKNQHVAISAYDPATAEYRVEGIATILGDISSLTERNPLAEEHYKGREDEVAAVEVSITYASKLDATVQAPEIEQVK